MKKIIVLLICLILLCSCGKKKEKNSLCPEFDGGKYTISFNSNGGNTYESIDICEGCERPESNQLPTPSKKGYTFGGWYYDELFLMKADVRTIDELDTYVAKDSKGCDYKYKDANLYALWIEK